MIRRVSIQRITSTNPLPENLRRGVVAIGNFDGIHLGHQKILQNTLEKAKHYKCPAIAFVFYPHPRHVLGLDHELFLITSPSIRMRLLDFMGFDAIIEYPFTQGLSNLSPVEFISCVIKKNLDPQHIVIGSDFRFGKNREGTADFLDISGKREGFRTTIVNAVLDEDKKTISSTQIRNLLSEGNVSQASELLGYHYTIEEKIISGRKLGRQIGFPTANMKLSFKTRLRYGVYAVCFRRQNGDCFEGVANFGVRPTIEKEGGPILETFIFDFSGDLYDECCQVSFFSFIRNETQFSSLQSLVCQMKKDEMQAKDCLVGIRPLSFLDQCLVFGLNDNAS